MAVAVQLLRQCFQNLCFPKEELSELRSLSQHSKHSCALRLLIWCIYRSSRSLQVPDELKLDQGASFEYKFASEDYCYSSPGPYLTSRVPFALQVYWKTPMRQLASSDESDIAQYIRKIEMHEFQSLLRSEEQQCASEFPLSNASKNLQVVEATGICERVDVDLHKSYELFAKLPVKGVDGLNFNVSDIQREVCHKRQLLEERLLHTLNDALLFREHYAFFAGSMQKLVSSDLLQMVYSTVLIHPRKRGYHDVMRETTGLSYVFSKTKSAVFRTIQDC